MSKKTISTQLLKLLDDSYFHYLATVNFKNLLTDNELQRINLMDEKQYNEAKSAIIEILAERLYSFKNENRQLMNDILESDFILKEEEEFITLT